MSGQDEDGDEVLCPMCLDELDITDKNFKPCTCGYQVSEHFFGHVADVTLLCRCAGFVGITSKKNAEESVLTAASLTAPRTTPSYPPIPKSACHFRRQRSRLLTFFDC